MTAPDPETTIKEWMKATLLLIQEERTAAQQSYKMATGVCKDFNREETLRQWEEIIDR